MGLQKVAAGIIATFTAMVKHLALVGTEAPEAAEGVGIGAPQATEGVGIGAPQVGTEALAAVGP